MRYLASFWHLPCYDWWEEHADHRHPSTLAAIRAGLTAALDLGTLDPALSKQASAARGEILQRIYAEGTRHGRLVKWLGGTDVDASLIACFTPFGVLPAEHPIAHATVEAIEQSIAHQGVHRYPGDTLYGGGEWPILAALLGWHYARIGRTAKAWQQLHWVASQANTAGELPEQSARRLLHPDHRRKWLDRWGPVATPLLWSHAMFIILATELGMGTAETQHPPLIRHQLPGPGKTRLASHRSIQTAARNAHRTQNAQSRSLPSPQLLHICHKRALHCTITSVDIVSFGDHRRDDEIRLFIRSALYQMLAAAFRDAGVSWRQTYHEDRGGGVLVVVGPHVPASLLLDPLILPLCARLRHHNKISSDPAKIRLRMALHAGPVLFDDNGVVGHAVIHLFRLLEAPALKKALAASRADLALVVSDHLHDTVIDHEAGLIDPESYQRLNIAYKETRSQAWLLTL